MPVIKMYGYEAAQQTEYQTKKWALRRRCGRCRPAMSSAT